MFMYVSKSSSNASYTQVKCQETMIKPANVGLQPLDTGAYTHMENPPTPTRRTHPYPDPPRPQAKIQELPKKAILSQRLLDLPELFSGSFTARICLIPSPSQTDREFPNWG